MSETNDKPLTFEQKAYRSAKYIYGKGLMPETARAELEHEWAGICTVLNQQYL